jgi:hypothetical protein
MLIHKEFSPLMGYLPGYQEELKGKFFLGEDKRRSENFSNQE